MTKKEKELQEEIERLKKQVQAANRKINVTNWNHSLRERGLFQYCNAPLSFGEEK